MYGNMILDDIVGLESSSDGGLTQNASQKSAGTYSSVSLNFNSEDENEPPPKKTPRND